MYKNTSLMGALCFLLVANAASNMIQFAAAQVGEDVCRETNVRYPDNIITLNSRLGKADNWTDICPPTHAVVPLDYTIATRYSGQALRVKCVPCCRLGCTFRNCRVAQDYPYSEGNQDQVAAIQAFIIEGQDFGCTACVNGAVLTVSEESQVTKTVGADVVVGQPQTTETYNVPLYGCPAPPPILAPSPSAGITPSPSVLPPSAVVPAPIPAAVIPAPIPVPAPVPAPTPLPTPVPAPSVPGPAVAPVPVAPPPEVAPAPAPTVTPSSGAVGAMFKGVVAMVMVAVMAL